MLELLNKFAWILSFTLCFSLGSILFGSIMSDGGFIVAILAAFIIKGMLFPKDYILSRLVFFKNQILKSETISESYNIQQESIKLASDSNSNSDVESNINLDTPTNIGETSHSAEIVSEEKKSSEKYSSHRNNSQEKNIVHEMNILEKFFAENLLAKVGGIFVFLGVLFLLGLIYTMIGPVTKLVLGFTLGGLCYASGVWLDKKGYIEESRIILGVALLINYLVILWGRYFLGNDETSSAMILSVGLTFFFLVANTIIAIITSQMYRSRPLLIFAFLVAYINPLLLGESSTEPYTLLGYTMIVTFGAMFMVFKNKDQTLFPLSFIFAAIIILLAPWSDASGWVAKLLCINTVSVIALYVSTIFTKQYKFGFEILISATFFLIATMGLLGGEILSTLQYLIMAVSSLSLMGLCYIAMNRGVYLYSIGTVGTILTLSPVILQNGITGGYGIISALIVVVFGAMNIGIVILQSQKLLAENTRNVISGLVSGSLFLILMIYLLGNEYLSENIQGGLFFVLSLIYAGVGYVQSQAIGIKNISKNSHNQDLIYSIFALSVSLFTLAVAFVFAENKAVVSIAWLLEANVLFYLAARIKSQKVAFLGIVLLAIGVVKFIDFTDIINIFSQAPAGNYGMLVTFIILFVSFILNLVFIKNKDMKGSSYLRLELLSGHHIFHVIGMSLLLMWGHQLLGITDNWFSLLYYSIAIMILGVLYEKLLSYGLQKVHLFAYLGCMGIHIYAFSLDMRTDSQILGISSLIACIYATPFVYDYIKKGSIQNKQLFIVFLSYLFILSSLYIYQIFGVTFMVTLYWGVLAFSVLWYGIAKDTLAVRTIGLYLITLTATKVFLYDIWMSVDDTVSRVVALIVVGILMIVLSAMYTKKFGNNLNSEFSISNLFPKDNTDSHKRYKSKNIDITNQETVEAKSSVQKDIENINVEGISSIKLTFNGDEKSVQIRAKNLLKMAKLITNSYKKTKFKPGELEKAYKLIESDYKSDLSPAQYTKIRLLVKRFVDEGGSIELIKK